MGLLESVIAATLVQGSVATTEPAAFTTIENATVIRQSPRPGVFSGVFAVWADFDVAVSGQPDQRMYLIYLVRDQFIPPTGSICRLVVERAPISGISSDGALDGRTLRNRVERLACDTGSWSEAEPRGG